MRIVFFGTSSFAAHVLKHLFSKKEEIVAVVTRPDRPKGRSLQMSVSPVKEVILPNSLPLFQPEKASTEEFVRTLNSFLPDLFVVVAYGEIMKENLLKCPRLGAINIHASLLPKYRGAAPIQRALMNGEKETGITIIEMVQKMDAGNILFMNKMAIPEDMNYGQLSESLAELACQAIDAVIQEFKTTPPHSIPQDETGVTFASKITPEDEIIHWEKSATEIHNQIRALSPYPGAWSYLTFGTQKKRLKILSSLVHSMSSHSPGTIYQIVPGKWGVACGVETLILKEIQLEGKKKMTAEEFFRGLQSKKLFLSIQ